MAIIVLLHVLAAIVGIISLLYAAVGTDINLRSLALVFALIILVCDAMSVFLLLESLKR